MRCWKRHAGSRRECRWRALGRWPRFCAGKAPVAAIAAPDRPMKLRFVTIRSGITVRPRGWGGGQASRQGLQQRRHEQYAEQPGKQHPAKHGGADRAPRSRSCARNERQRRYSDDEPDRRHRHPAESVPAPRRRRRSPHARRRAPRPAMDRDCLAGLELSVIEQPLPRRERRETHSFRVRWPRSFWLRRGPA
jgi:hypothetical protein